MMTIVRMMHHMINRGFTLPIWVFSYVVALTFKECLSKTLRRNAIIIKSRYDFNSMVEIRHEKVLFIQNMSIISVELFVQAETNDL